VSLLGGASLFERTAARARALAGPGRVFVVCGEEQAAWVRRQAPWIAEDRVVRESVGRDTAASVTLAALRVRREKAPGVLVVLPADHVVSPPRRFVAAVRRAARAADASGSIALLGMPPRSGLTGYGYVTMGARTRHPGVRRAAGFVEKPGAARAARLARDRRHLWNCGIFVGRPEVMLREASRHAPRLVAPLERCTARLRLPWRVPRRVMRSVPKIPFDRAVLERSGALLVARGDFRWSDLGTWSALADFRGATGGAEGDTVTDGETTGCASFNPGGLTAFVGVRDLLVVRDGEVVLVCRRGAEQRVRDVARRLRGRLAAYA
jgi:mannose-1-phosphate guanylyltransferase